MSIARTAAVLLVLACAGCSGGGQYASHWDGRRGYDGNGDYGYDPAGARSEAGSYRARAARSYPEPGPRDDPWGPYIREAAARFTVPERWIRAVMRQESGGHLYESDGSLITSSSGAMGLMQLMPRTWEMLRQRHGLGGDPYAPRDNILAGTAYIREMYDRYGAPAFLAAYNAGPYRLDAYLAGTSPLPDETVNYLASVAPRLGTETPGTGPLAVYAGAAAAGPSDADRAYAGGGMTGLDYAAARRTDPAGDDPAARAFEGGGLVTPDAPTGVLTAPARPAPAADDRGVTATPVFALPRLISVAAAATPGGAWAIQVGAYPDRANSERAIAAARARMGELAIGAQPAIMSVQRAGILYRARLVGLTAGNAAAACARLSGQGIDCFTVPPGS